MRISDRSRTPAALATIVVVFAIGGAASGCRKKATAQQCGELVDHFAGLVVAERFPDAGADAIAAERTRERAEANGDDAFKNCPSEVQADELACAMKATTSSAVLKCLE
jgi:hypothetical protein